MGPVGAGKPVVCCNPALFSLHAWHAHRGCPHQRPLGTRPPNPIQVLLEGNAMVLCSLIHASILKSGRQYVSSQEEADFMARARQFAAK